MVDEGHSHISDATRRRGTFREIVEIPPRPSLARPHPLKEVPESAFLTDRVVKTLAVEVIRRSGGSVGHRFAVSGSVTKSQEQRRAPSLRNDDEEVVVVLAGDGD